MTTLDPKAKPVAPRHKHRATDIVGLPSPDVDTLAALLDVDVITTPPVDGNALIYAAADKKWEPGTVEVPKPAKDRFTVAATPLTTYTLTAIPVTSSLGSSVILSLNGVVLVEGTAYTVNYTTGVVTLTSTPTTGQVLYAEYWTLGATWVVPLTPPGTFDTEIGGTDAGASGQVSRSYSGEHDTLLLVTAMWVTGANTSHAMSITDTGGLTWVKLGEVTLDNTGNPDSAGVAIFGARAPSTPTSGTVTVTVPAHATFDVQCFTYATATAAGNVASGHSATGSGLNVSTLTLTLGTAPTPAQGTFIAYMVWPTHTVTEDSAYTEVIQGNNPGAGGPYGQMFKYAISYDNTGPSGSATLTNSAGGDTLGVITTITPDAA